MGTPDLGQGPWRGPDSRLLAAAFEASHDAMVIADRDGVILWVNAAFTRMTGYPAEEALGQNPRLLKSGAHDAAYYASLWQTILSGQAWQGEFVNRRKDGALYYVEKSITPVRDERGEITHFIAVGHDITQRKRSGEALRESEQRFRSYFESPLIGIAIVSPEKRWLEVNHRFCQMVGYSREELAGITWADLTPLEDLAAQMPSYERVLAGVEDSYTLEKHYVRKDGKLIDVAVSSSCVRRPDGSPNYFVTLVQDITERKQLEEEFLQAQKLESVARLAGGLAHDFNNTLTVINGYTQLLARQFTAGSPAFAGLEEIGKAGEHGAELTRRLLAFGRKQLLQPRVLDLNRVVEDTRAMLEGMIGEDVQLVTLLDPDLGAVKADPGQIQQVVMNLAVNARDAMPLGGKLLVETVNADTAQRYVVLTVSDTGQGMDKETLRHLFEPFFTTKEPGKGTGLGLATVHGIVEQSGGHIFVSSEPGIGTSFRIYLPRVDGPAPEERQPVAGLADGGSETILLVEDHDAVRRLAALVLEDRGYRVLAAAGGAEALDVLERSRGAVDLLVTDVVMPGMSSLEMVERARSSHPGLKVLFMSGYTDDAMIHQKIQGIGAPYLEKPFSPGALAAKVREALG